ncbi:glucose-1-phosphate adenylyltransferase [Klebsiella pneumoniae]|nr:glucose-1-phosphate adenylyltransferase [Klebsiella pneumoniae]
MIGENAVEDARRFYRSEEGIVLVTKEMLDKLEGMSPFAEKACPAAEKILPCRGSSLWLNNKEHTCKFYM